MEIIWYEEVPKDWWGNKKGNTLTKKKMILIDCGKFSKNFSNHFSYYPADELVSMFVLFSDPWWAIINEFTRIAIPEKEYRNNSIVNDIVRGMHRASWNRLLMRAAFSFTHSPTIKGLSLWVCHFIRLSCSVASDTFYVAME